jgi:class 3 adenylate cyclase/tetratricopeptide (TPR) repeat protein
MNCASCGAKNRIGRKFCVECGSKLARNCPACGTPYAADEKFCGECGAALAEKAPANVPKPSGGSPSAPGIQVTAEQPVDEVLDGERKTVTALFADIKGSMDLMEDIDPEEARAIVDPALKLMIDGAHHYDGYIVQSTGDGIFALFGAPLAHEDHPQRALYAAVRMQEDMKHYAEKLRAEEGVNLQVRVGVNTGEVVVRSIKTRAGHIEYTPIGHSISLASRLQTLAAPGSIALSETVRKLVEGYFALKPMGPARIKGASEPINVYEVTGLGPLRTRLQRSAGRGLSKFVGRQREMAAIAAAAEQAHAGHGQIVATMAAAGTGKSRLFFEFKAAAQSRWMVLETFSFSHGKASAYLPLIELLRGYFGIDAGDDARRRREKVAGKIAILDRALEDTLPYLFGLLGIVEGDDPLTQMDGQVKKRRILEAIKRILLRESLNEPLMVIFEDLHWIDEETQELLDLLADSIATTKILLLVNYRPEYSLRWNSKTYCRELPLDPLGRESAGEMLSALLGDSAELAPLKRVIIQKTGGNPFFIEETVQALLDEGAVVRNGTMKLTKPLSDLRIPPTVQAVLAARIDRLPPEERDLLKTLAVIGSEFPLALVRQVVEMAPEQLDHMLSGLETGEFIYEQPAAADIEYTFKHALTRDVAYNSLLSERRRLLHERSAQAVETLYHERLEDHYAELAHHYRSSNNATKAVEYLRLAGEQAVRRGAYAQAMANVEPALALVELFPEGPQRLRAELGTRLTEGMVVSALYGAASAERLHSFQRVCEVSEQLGDKAALLQGLLNLAHAYYNRGEGPRALETTLLCLQLAEQTHDTETLAAVHYLRAVSAYFCGDLLQAYSLFGDLMKRIGSAHQGAAAKILPQNLWVMAPTVFARVELAQGRPDEALRLSNEALRRGHQLKHPLSLASAVMFAALLRAQRREPEAVRELAEELIALAEEHGLLEHMAAARLIRGWAVAELGEPEQAVAELDASGPLFLAWFVAEKLPQAYLRAGLAERALAALNEALAGTDRSRAHIEDAELYRLKGEAIFMRDSSAIAEAESCYRKAVEIATAQCAKWWELCATVSLARLLVRTGRRDEARVMLTEIYSTFTEGFDTADLKDAKALLEELST